MKRTKFFLLGLAALSLAACNKDNGIDPVAETDATVSFVIKTGEGRAVGDGLADAKITKLTAMVYVGQAQEAIKTVDDENGVTKVEGIKCKSGGGRKLVVIANHEFANLTALSYDDVMKLTTTLTAENQSAKNLVMTGESETFTLKPGNNHYGYPAGTTTDNAIQEGSPLAVTRVHAGISFASATYTPSAQYTNYYKFDTATAKIAALVAKKDSKLFGTSLVTDSKAYLYGVATPTGIYTPIAADGETYTLQESLATNYAARAGFYVLESDYKVGAKLRPTILCIYGKLLNKDGQDLTGTALAEAVAAGYCNEQGITYYPVLVNHKGNGYTYSGAITEGQDKIVRNNHYKISLTITGPGTNKPEDSVLATLNVTCTVTPWVVVNQTATW